MSESTLSPADLDDLAERVAARVADRLAARPMLVDRVTLSQQLGIGPATVERRTADGTIPAIRCGRRVLYDPQAVIASLAKTSNDQGKRPTDDESAGNVAETPDRDTSAASPVPASAFARALRRRTPKVPNDAD